MKWNVQFSRYVIVGVASNTVGYLLYLLLTHMGIGPKTAMTLLYLSVVLLTFYFNRNWSFRHEGHVSSAFIRYGITYLLGYLLNFALLWLAVDWLRQPHQIVQLAAIFLVAAVLFLLQRYWVFATPAIRRGMA